MTSDNYEIVFPTKVRFGANSLDTLMDEVNTLGAERILIVTDPGICEAGLVDNVRKQLASPRLSGVLHTLGSYLLR
jgi:alcohol dehydrogenase class IV